MINKNIFNRCFGHKGRYWYKNLKYIPTYFRLIHHLIKYGYDEYATWETFYWFIETMRSILTSYRKKHWGCPFGMDEEEWDDIIDRMIALLDDMDECNPKYYAEDYNKKYDEMHAAKDEFFKLFSEYFYNLWD